MGDYPEFSEVSPSTQDSTFERVRERDVTTAEVCDMIMKSAAGQNAGSL